MPLRGKRRIGVDVRQNLLDHLPVFLFFLDPTLDLSRVLFTVEEYHQFDVDLAKYTYKVLDVSQQFVPLAATNPVGVRAVEVL